MWLLRPSWPVFRSTREDYKDRAPDLLTVTHRRVAEAGKRSVGTFFS
jgi:hypothetical protein